MRAPRYLLVLWLAILCAGGCDKMTARATIKEGNDLYRAGKFQDALKKFQAAERLDPDFAILHLHLGYTHMALRTTAEGAAADAHARAAIKAFELYQKLNPGDERGPKFYLQMLLDSGRNKEALAFLEQQHRKNPRDVKVVASLGVVSSKAGRFTDALKWYEKRAAMLPGEAKARYLIGTLCWERLYKNEAMVGVERIKISDRGIAALEEAVKLDPDYVEALTYINLLYRERSKGQRDEAARDRDMARARQYYKRALATMKRKGKKG